MSSRGARRLDTLRILWCRSTCHKTRRFNLFTLEGVTPMSFIARLQSIFGAKVNKTSTTRTHAPVDYSLTRLQSSLRQISDSWSRSTARRMLEAQRGQAQKRLTRPKNKPTPQGADLATALWSARRRSGTPQLATATLPRLKARGKQDQPGQLGRRSNSSRPRRKN